MTTTYTKLKSGEWGVRMAGTPKVGARVSVSKKDGSTKTETIARVVWSGDGISLCAIAKGDGAKGKNWDASRFNGYGRARGGYAKACVTGGNCSSLGSGRSCGGHDCDGY